MKVKAKRGRGPESNRRRRHWCPDEFRCWLLVDLLSDTHTYTHRKDLHAFSFLPFRRPRTASDSDHSQLGLPTALHSGLSAPGSTGARRPNTPPLALLVIDLSVVSCGQCSEWQVGRGEASRPRRSWVSVHAGVARVNRGTADKKLGAWLLELQDLCAQSETCVEAHVWGLGWQWLDRVDNNVVQV